MGARRRTRQGLSIHVESVLGKGISMQIETVAKEGFLPVRVHPTDAGADLRADIPEPVTLQPRESTFFNTGIEVAIPEGYFGALAIRSSLACKHGLMLANSLGIIDSCYLVGALDACVLGGAPFIASIFGFLQNIIPVWVACYIVTFFLQGPIENFARKVCNDPAPAMPQMH